MNQPLDALHISISPCPNDTFAFGYLIEQLLPWAGPSLKFSFADIESLNQCGLSEQAPDVLKFSYALWPDLKKNYRLCPYGSAMGMGVGPLLVGHESLELDQIQKVLVPGLMTTAHLLYQQYGPRCPVQVERYDRILPQLREHKDWAGVIIHESRFTYQADKLHLLCDLGQSWESDTRAPLPLGGIAIHRRVPLKCAQQFSQALKLSLQSAWADRRPILKLMRSLAQEMDDDVMARHVELYVNKYSAGLDSVARGAIEKLSGASCGEEWL